MEREKTVYRGFVFIIIVLIITASPVAGASSKPGAVIRYMEPEALLPPEQNEEIFFKRLPRIAVDDGGCIYILHQSPDILLKMDVRGQLLKRIGQTGRGPGDVLRPACIDFHQHGFYLYDDNGMSVFNEDGRFMCRFPLAEYVIDCAGLDGSVVVAAVTEKGLFTVYSETGETKRSFGMKYKPVYSNFKALPRSSVDNTINQGKIVVAPTCMYYVTQLFGDVFRYSREGEFLGKAAINMDEFREEYKKNFRTFFESGNINKTRGVESWPLIRDAEYYDGFLYLLLGIYRKPEEVRILEVDCRDFKTRREFRFRYRTKGKPLKIWTNNFEMVGKGKRLIFYIPMIYDDSQDISVFKYTMEKVM